MTDSNNYSFKACTKWDNFLNMGLSKTEQRLCQSTATRGRWSSAVGRWSPAEISQTPPNRNHTSPDFRTCSTHAIGIGNGTNFGSNRRLRRSNDEDNGGAAGSPSCQGYRRSHPSQSACPTPGKETEIAKLQHREGTNLPEGGRRLFAAPIRGVPLLFRRLQRPLPPLLSLRRFRPSGLTSSGVYFLSLSRNGVWWGASNSRGVIGCGRRRRVKVAMFSLRFHPFLSIRFNFQLYN